MFIDPSGLERIVVSGGVYSRTKQGNGAYYYEFIDTALNDIDGINDLFGDKERVTWAIADTGFTDRDWKLFFEEASKYDNVNILKLSLADDLISYINNGRDL